LNRKSGATTARENDDLAREELWSGLREAPRSIPCKYFYDDLGSRLFDKICDLPEYYPTRAELNLLRRVSAEIVEMTRAEELVELGSGMARKSLILLEAFVEARGAFRYVPLDISEEAIRSSESLLSRELPSLEVQGVVGDYLHDLGVVETHGRSLVAFLGSTIGNFEGKESRAFLSALARRMGPDDFFFIGLDLVKPLPVLEAAYNDAQGVTAEFNRNILRVVNGILEGDFRPQRFEHRAIFNQEKAQIEMYLVAKESMEVKLEGLGRSIALEAGEAIHTESSRKFTRQSAEELLKASGFALAHWFQTRDGYFGAALARVEDR
jgi:L-histidine N-alpha-methyltransferase